jgi:hypothetical protein
MCSRGWWWWWRSEDEPAVGTDAGQSRAVGDHCSLRQAMQIHSAPPPLMRGADAVADAARELHRPGVAGTRRIPNNSTAGTAARSGAVTTGPSGAQLRTISPVVSAGVAAGMFTGRVRPVGCCKQQTGDVMVGCCPGHPPG